MDKTGLGVLGESRAADELCRNGYKILERNFRSRFGEIDIVAQKDHTVCFVEVKTRGPNSLGRPCEAVTASKQRKLMLTAEYYIARHRYAFERKALQPRFDCIEVYTDADGRPVRINHIRNAF